MAFSAREQEAIKNFEMISRGESKIRKWIGSALFIFTLALFFYKASYGSVISCGLFSFGLGAGICVVRTGLESQ